MKIDDFQTSPFQQTCTSTCYHQNPFELLVCLSCISFPLVSKIIKGSEQNDSSSRRLSHRCREKLARNVHASFNSSPSSFNSRSILVSVIEAAGRSGFGNREVVDLAMHALTQHDPAAPACVPWLSNPVA